MLYDLLLLHVPSLFKRLDLYELLLVFLFQLLFSFLQLVDLIFEWDVLGSLIVDALSEFSLRNELVFSINIG